MTAAIDTAIIGLGLLMVLWAIISPKGNIVVRLLISIIGVFVLIVGIILALGDVEGRRW